MIKGYQQSSPPEKIMLSSQWEKQQVHASYPWLLYSCITKSKQNRYVAPNLSASFAEKLTINYYHHNITIN